MEYADLINASKRNDAWHRKDTIIHATEHPETHSVG